jgi:hypothetical protein
VPLDQVFEIALDVGSHRRQLVGNLLLQDRMQSATMELMLEPVPMDDTDFQDSHTPPPNQILDTPLRRQAGEAAENGGSPAASAQAGRFSASS